MKNIVTATIHFSFKGKKHAPSITIELDKHLQSSGKLPELYSFIAKENNLDLYSYEYEMMQSAEISFSDAEGIIANFIVDERLNTEEFISAWQKSHQLEKLLEITELHMNITDFRQHQELKQAMLAAYQLGKQDTAQND